MITGGRILSVEAKRDKEESVKGLSINIGLDDVVVKNDEVTIQYTFNVKYEDNVGHLKIIGVLQAKEDAKTTKEISKQWKESKRLPDEFAEIVLNTINYTCGVNGTLVVQPLRLTPPMQMPRVKIEKEPGEKRSGGAA
jgi:hypothetical protein